MKHGSLFSGIGGFDLAANWMGWENVFQVEKDDWCRRVLSKNFPDTARYEDIKEFSGAKYIGSIDVLSGGFPCQPFSKAGKKKGTSDDRYLWPEMLRVIREIKPRWIVGENVYGIIGMALNTVLNEVEAEGYTTETYIIPAYAVGGFHNRDRVWIIGRKINAHDTDSNSIGSYCQEMHKYRSPEFRHEQISLPGSLVSERIRKGTDPRVFRDFNGIPNRVDRLRGVGNAIVPQIALQIFKAIEQYNALR